MEVPFIVFYLLFVSGSKRTKEKERRDLFLRLTFARLAAAATDLPARTWLELGKGRQCEGERKARESVCVCE